VRATLRCISANDEPRFRHARWPDRSSISNFTYNHIGHFAASNHAFAKGVFLGGLLRRYPSLNFGFMEGGVSWACQLCADLIEHWEKRRPAGLQNPTATSIAEMHRLIAQYGDARLKANADEIMNSVDFLRPEFVVDDFAAAGIQSKDDIRAAFSSNFYFGCEADDRTTLWAFDPRMAFGCGRCSAPTSRTLTCLISAR